MNIVQQYLRRAEECRKLAVETAVPGHRKAIEVISDTWLRLADERLKFLKSSKNTLKGDDGERRDDDGNPLGRPRGQ